MIRIITSRLDLRPSLQPKSATTRIRAIKNLLLLLSVRKPTERAWQVFLSAVEIIGRSELETYVHSVVECVAGVDVFAVATGTVQDSVNY